MATIDSDEPMDCSPSLAASEETQKALEVTLSIQWLDPLESKTKYTLEVVLQSWANTLKTTSTEELTCDVLHVSEDSDKVVVSIKPPPDSSVLEALKGQTLGKKGAKTLRVTSACWEGSDATNAPPSPPPPLETRHGGGQEDEAARVTPPEALSMAGDEHFELLLSTFLALWCTSQKEVALIEKRNNCRIEGKVKVAFTQIEGGTGDPQRALSEFQTLIQRLSSSQLHGSAIPSRGRDPEEVMDVPSRVGEAEKSFQVGRSSPEQHGPNQSKDATESPGRIADAADAPNTSSWTTLGTPGDVKFNIDDPIFCDGITMEDSFWQLMINSCSEDIVKVQHKFGVQLQTEFSQGKTRVRSVGGRNAVLEGNAVRALFHLYKRFITSPFNTNQPSGAAGPPRHHWGPPRHLSDPPRNLSDPPGYHSDPLNPHWNPPGYHSDPPRNLSDPPGYHSDPPKPHWNPPGYHSDPPRNLSDPPGYHSDPPRNLSDPPGYHSDPPKHPKWDYNNSLSNGRSGDSAVKDIPAAQAASGGDVEIGTCPICLNEFTDKKQMECKHEFCRACLNKAVEKMGPCCPVCRKVFGVMVGNQPDGGRMTTKTTPVLLPGFKNCGTIVITYHIPSGIQTEKHPNPGMPYHGTHREAYLPDNKEGKQVLKLLERAFKQKLIFTVGESRTTNAKDQVTWNDIHHKTSMSGTSGYAYPDKDYLKRVRGELKAKGIE